MNFEFWIGHKLQACASGVFEEVERIGRRIDESIVNPYIL